jgi:hypothetical protein
MWSDYRCTTIIYKSAISENLVAKYYAHQQFTYTECPRRNVPDFGRAFLMLKYADITQNTYVQN